MKTDLDALRICRFEEFRIAPLARIPMNSLPEVVSFEPLVFAGCEFSCIAALRSRLPVKNLRLRVEGLSGCACPVRQAVFPEQAALIPDLIDSDDRTVTAGGNTTLLFLLRFRLPPELIPGTYPVKVATESATHRSEEHIFPIHVLERPQSEMKPERKITFWPHWETFCRHLNLKLWSEPFWEAAEAYLKELANGGMNVIMVSLCHDPFRYPLPPEYGMFNRFPEMIRWEKDSHGKWKFDYKIFDRYVNLNLKLGIDHEIECHSLLPCKEQEPQLCWFESGRKMRREYRFGDTEHHEAWNAFLRDFHMHCRKRGWDHLLSVCPYDEPVDLERFRRAAALIRETMPGVKVTSAVTAQRAVELSDVLDIATIHLEAGYDHADHEKLRATGVSLRWYNCCTPFWGNTLFGCELSDAYRIGWMTENGNFEGFLRWSVIDWPDLLPEEPGFNWPTGDTFLLYPGKYGPRESLRWHAFKQGMHDLCLCSAYLHKPEVAIFIQKNGFPGAADRKASPGELQQDLYRILGKYTSVSAPL